MAIKHIVKLLVREKTELKNTVSQLVESFHRFQDQVISVLNAVVDSPFINNGQFISNIHLNNGSQTVVKHDLGVPYTHWILTSKNAESDVWEVQTSQPAREIVLTSSQEVIVSIYITGEVD